MKNSNFLILGMFLLFLIIPLVSAVPPVTTTQQFTTGYEIRIPQDNILKTGQSYSFNIHVYNITNGYPIIKGISCYFHLYNSTGNHQLILTSSTTDDIFDYEFLVAGGNFTNGVYYANYQCNSSVLGGYHSEPIFVNPVGRETTTADSIFYIGLLTLLFSLLFATFGFLLTSRNINWTIVTSVFSYFISLTLIFTLWKFAENYMYDLQWIVSLFYMLFIITLILMFPFIIGMVFYLFLNIFNERNMREMTAMGYSREETKHYR